MAERRCGTCRFYGGQKDRNAYAFEATLKGLGCIFQVDVSKLPAWYPDAIVAATRYTDPQDYPDCPTWQSREAS